MNYKAFRSFQIQAYSHHQCNFYITTLIPRILSELQTECQIDICFLGIITFSGIDYYSVSLPSRHVIILQKCSPPTFLLLINVIESALGRSIWPWIAMQRFFFFFFWSGGHISCSRVNEIIKTQSLGRKFYVSHLFDPQSTKLHAIVNQLQNKEEEHS